MVVIGVVNTVLMSVLERTREFGLLRALGLNRHSLMLLVALETLLLSVLAILIGWIIGGSIHLWFSRHGVDLTAIIGDGAMLAGTRMDPVIYTELSVDRIIQLTLIIFIATLITGILSGHQGGPGNASGGLANMKRKIFQERAEWNC